MNSQIHETSAVFGYPTCAFFQHKPIVLDAHIASVNLPGHANMNASEAVWEYIYSAPMHVAMGMFVYNSHSSVKGEGLQAPDPETPLVSILIWFVWLHAILSVILKYRAAYHRKIRRWERLGNDAKPSDIVWMYVRELIRCEAKMSPIRKPIFPAIWNSFCPIVVWALFPRSIALVYLYSSAFSTVIQMGRVTFDEHYVKESDILFYNGRRYRFFRDGLCTCTLKDEDQNVMYYSACDLYGLLPLDTVRLADQEN